MQTPKYDKTTAGLLGILLGGLGIHKFYLDKNGFPYLLLCWTLVPAIIGFFEGIEYLSMPQEKFDAKFNQEEKKVEEPKSDSIQEKDVPEQIAKLHKLKEAGALTEEEYDAEKAKLLYKKN